MAPAKIEEYQRYKKGYSGCRGRSWMQKYLAIQLKTENIFFEFQEGREQHIHYCRQYLSCTVILQNIEEIICKKTLLTTDFTHH
jgi:hypothetical protein